MLYNNWVRAVVVPSISRLAFIAKSPDIPNILHLDPALADIENAPKNGLDTHPRFADSG